MKAAFYAIVAICLLVLSRSASHDTVTFIVSKIIKSKFACSAVRFKKVSNTSWQ